MNVPHNNQKNRLLDVLPKEEYERLSPYLEPILIPTGEALYESGHTLRYIYLPTTCIVSLLYGMENGGSSEIAVVGNEGIIGIALFMGGGSMPNRAIVQSTGYAYRIRQHHFMQEFNRHGTLLHLMLRYTQALITQMAQTAVCNRYHSIDQQLCRWLLLNIDRLSSNKLAMTHELIAMSLGVRREGVTEAARKLQKAGMIDYRRGHITVLDRPGLEARSCECYQVVKREYDRLLPGSTFRETQTLRIQAVVHRESGEENVVLHA
jgi:CRP-like cAMP-binding protein